MKKNKQKGSLMLGHTWNLVMFTTAIYKQPNAQMNKSCKKPDLFNHIFIFNLKYM